MTEFFQYLLEWVALHPYWSGTIIFLVAMAESLAIVGLIVPGVVIMFGIGALIAAGSIEFWSAMTWAVAGAVVGDGLSFWLGRHFQDRLIGIWPFKRYPDTLARGVAFFEKYGGKSVAFGRFFGPVRAVIPLVAGMMRMSTWRFLVANVLSALAWAPAYLLPGIVFGASLELASEVAFRLVILILLIAVTIWVAAWLVRRVFLLIQPHATAMVQAAFSWSRLHPWGDEVTAALSDPNHPEAKGLSILASLLILATGLFALILGGVLGGTGLADLDNTVLQGLQSLRTPWADGFMISVTWLADIRVALVLIVGILMYLLWRGHRRTTLYWLSAVAFYLVGSAFLKWLLKIPRPEVVALQPQSYSFPSGHTLLSVLLYGFLAVIIARAMPLRWRWAPYSLAGSIIAAVALSRLYLGVHWLSDILGSITLGLVWITTLSIAYHRHTQVETHWRSLSLTALVLVSGAMVVQDGLYRDVDLKRYAVSRPDSRIPASQWIETGWKTLPRKRFDSRGIKDHPLNLQYAGPLDLFQTLMEQKGWRPAPMLEAANLLKLLSPRLELQQLPVLPQVHDGQHETVTLEKPLPDGQRLVLRLWPANILLTPGGEPLWIGQVSQQRQVQLLKMITFAATSHQFETAFQELVRDTESFESHRVTTDGRVLLLASDAPDSSRAAGP